VRRKLQHGDTSDLDSRTPCGFRNREAVVGGLNILRASSFSGFAHSTVYQGCAIWLGIGGDIWDAWTFAFYVTLGI
jgi:hypothetical protein